MARSYNVSAFYHGKWWDVLERNEMKHMWEVVSPIWGDVAATRLFLLVLFNAENGKILKSYSKLQDDLAYLENKQVKKYNFKTIKRALNALTKIGLLRKQDTEQGMELGIPETLSGIGLCGGPVSGQDTEQGSGLQKTEKMVKNELLDQKILFTTTEVCNNSKFEKFWAIYPNKKAKKDAVKVWIRDELDYIADDIIAAVERQKKTEAWTQDGGKYIPYPATFLNGHRWEDEIEPIDPYEGMGPNSAYRGNKIIV